jgi:Protein of unknown function (DUF3363)
MRLRQRVTSSLASARSHRLGDTGRYWAEGQRVAGIYRRSVMLASGRYAMLDDGFSLVRWRPVIERRLGQQIAARLDSPTAHREPRG